MDNLAFSLRIVTLAAECPPRQGERKALLPFYGVLLYLPPVTGAAIAFLDRLMGKFQAADGAMTCSCHTGARTEGRESGGQAKDCDGEQHVDSHKPYPWKTFMGDIQ
jgi:hypothetical protein